MERNDTRHSDFFENRSGKLNLFLKQLCLFSGKRILFFSSEEKIVTGNIFSLEVFFNVSKVGTPNPALRGKKFSSSSFMWKTELGIIFRTIGLSNRWWSIPNWLVLIGKKLRIFCCVDPKRELSIKLAVMNISFGKFE